MSKTFESYSFDNSLLVEQSTDDGSIVKIETYNKILDEWIDVTAQIKNTVSVRVLAESFFEQYQADKKAVSSRTPLRDMMPDILGLKRQA